MFTPEPRQGRQNLPLPSPELYNVVQDPEESYDRAERNPAVVAEIRSRVDRIIRTFPRDVLSTYTDSMKRKVFYTPPDALPVEDAP
jgi:hypothetical protein